MKSMLGAPMLALLFLLPGLGRATVVQAAGAHIYVSPTAGIWRWDESAAAFLEVPDRTGFVWGGRVGYSPMEAFAFEGVVLTGTNTGKFTTGASPEPEERSLRLTQTEFSIIVNFQSIVSRAVYPFLDLGIGLSFRSGGLDIQGESSFNDTRFNFHIGGGVKIELDPRAAVRFNIRDTFFTMTQFTDGTQQEQVAVDSVEISLGLDYRIPIGEGGGSDRLR